MEDYLSNFPIIEPVSNRSTQLFTLESSPQYQLSEPAARRIKQAMPHAKILFMFREPAHRFYSYWRYFAQTGKNARPDYQEKRNFSEVAQHSIQAHEECQAAGTDTIDCWWKREKGHFYIGEGHYERTLQIWRKHFDPEQILVIFAEDLELEKERVLLEIFNWLGVSRFEVHGNKAIKERWNVNESIRLSKQDNAVLQRVCAYYQTLNAALEALVGSLPANWKNCSDVGLMR